MYELDNPCFMAMNFSYRSCLVGFVANGLKDPSDSGNFTGLVALDSFASSELLTKLIFLPTMAASFSSVVFGIGFSAFLVVGGLSDVCSPRIDPRCLAVKSCLPNPKKKHLNTSILFKCLQVCFRLWHTLISHGSLFWLGIFDTAESRFSSFTWNVVVRKSWRWKNFHRWLQRSCGNETV